MTDDMPDKVTVSTRVEDMPTAPVAHSSKRECEGCGKEVWISPATNFEIERGVYPDVVYCVHCATDELEDEDQ